ncbi:MAG: hypothetical protein U9R42_04215 [Bacteroidota bacterium]|nr:hypothetical protein [Bacteroidota bacterium]
MKLKYLLTILTISSFSLLLNNCCDDDDNNPCKSLEPTNADFITEKVFSIWGAMTYFEEDTFIKESTIRFSVKDNNVDSCLWKVGEHSDTITEKSFYLTFDEAYENITIRLIVFKKPFKDCFPKDDGIDTSYKTIYLIEKDNLNYVGKYHGYNINNSDTKFTITIDSNSYHHYPINGVVYHIINLPDGNSPIYKPWGELYHCVKIFPGWSNFYLKGSGKTHNVVGWGYYNNNLKMITINYSYKDYNHSDKINTTFIGYKTK